MFNICNHKALLNELKCKQCSKVLSVLPVYYRSAVGNICGRCASTVDWMIANGTLERAVAYEAVAKFLLFPCHNYEQGCEAKLKHTEIVQHEQQCKFILAQCPFNLEFKKFSTKCDWHGISKNLAQHLQSSHKDFLQNGLPSFVMNVDDTHIKVFFTTEYDKTFLVVTQYLKNVNKFYCMVMCCEKEPEHLYYRYELEVGRHNDYFLTLRKPETEAYCNVQEIVNNQDKMIAIDISSIHTMLNDPKGFIYCKIGINKKTAEEISAITGKISSVAASNYPNLTENKPKPEVSPKPEPKVPQNNKETRETPKNVSVNEPKTSSSVCDTKLKEKAKNTFKIDSIFTKLECPVCNHYMFPPIFICPTGHSICNTCRFKIQVCPLCQSVIQNTRNFTLEALATSIKYPCTYMDYGCRVRLSCEDIKQHELHCIRGRCPLKLLVSCEDKDGIVDVIGHLREKHASYMVDTNRQYSRDIAGKVTTSYWATTLENEIFMICCGHSSATGPIKFNVLHVGMCKDKPKYKFEFQFCDQTGNGLKLVISQLCQVFPSSSSLALKSCLTVPQDMLQPFINKIEAPKIFFKFNIQKL